MKVTKKTVRGTADELSSDRDRTVLLELLGAALGIGTDPVIPDDTDWGEVARLSYEQKVPALAVDGLKVSGYDPYRGLDAGRTEELKPVLGSWYADAADAGPSYTYYVAVLKTLCQIFVDNGLTPVILKGYGLSLNYPEPCHRGAGDIDIFLVDRDGRPAAVEGNRIAKEVLGLDVDQEEDGHHSHFTFKGVVVENHYELMGSNRGGEREIELGELLKEMLLSEGRDHPGPVIPSPTFNAVFLLQHMCSHFRSRIFTYRQFTDHICLLRSCRGGIDWDTVGRVTEKYGLKPLSDALCGIYRDTFGVEEEFLPPSYTYDPEVSALLLKSIFHTGDIPCDGIHLFRHYYMNVWYYRFFFGHRNWIDSIFRHALSFIQIHSGNIWQKLTSSGRP